MNSNHGFQFIPRLQSFYCRHIPLGVYLQVESVSFLLEKKHQANTQNTLYAYKRKNNTKNSERFKHIEWNNTDTI